MLPQTKRAKDALVESGIPRNRVKARTPYKAEWGYLPTEIFCYAPKRMQMAAIPKALQNGLDVTIWFSVREWPIPGRRRQKYNVWVHFSYSLAYGRKGKLTSINTNRKGEEK